MFFKFVASQILTEYFTKNKNKKTATNFVTSQILTEKISQKKENRKKECLQCCNFCSYLEHKLQVKYVNAGRVGGGGGGG